MQVSWKGSKAPVADSCLHKGHLLGLSCYSRAATSRAVDVVYETLGWFWMIS